jgi:hypothetical protein
MDCRLVFRSWRASIEFVIALEEDLQVAAGEPIGQGNIADGRMQPHVVLMVNEALEKVEWYPAGKAGSQA